MPGTYFNAPGGYSGIYPGAGGGGSNPFGNGGAGVGCHFAVSRSYTSFSGLYAAPESGGGGVGFVDTSVIPDSPSLNANAFGQLGNNWMHSTSNQLFLDSGVPSRLVAGHGTGVEIEWDAMTGTGGPKADGPNAQTLTNNFSGLANPYSSIPGAIASDIEYVRPTPAYLLAQPGGRQYLFAGDDGGRTEGRLIAEYDGMGRLNSVYEYELCANYDENDEITNALLHEDDPSKSIGDDPTDDIIAIRLARVYLFNHLGDCAGFIQYTYIQQPYNAGGFETAPIGPVKTLQVYRIPDPAAPGTSVLTQEVEYFYEGFALDSQYRDESFGADAIGDTTTNDASNNYQLRKLYGNQELGPIGSLIQVYKRILLNDGNYREFITQYRYHDGGESWYPEDNDERLDTQGAASQLRLEFEPYVIEWLAEQVPAWDLVDAASALLATADGDPIGSTSITPIELASRVVSYDLAYASPKVSRMYRSGDCGCGGTAGPAPTKFTYDYLEYTLPSWQSTSLGDILCSAPNQGTTLTGKTTSIVEYSFNGSSYVQERETRLDYVPTTSEGGVPGPADRLVARAQRACDPTTGCDSSDWWVTGYRYEPCSSLLSHVYKPSAISGYTPAVDATTAASWAPEASEGYVVRYAYDSEGRRTKKWIRNAPDAAASVSDPFDLVWEATFLTGASRPDLLATVKRYREAGSTADDDIELLTYDYGFWDAAYTGGPPSVAWRKVTVEAELSTENGPAGSANTYSSYELYDQDGNSIWTIAHDGTASLMAYDADTAKVTSKTVNATPASGAFDAWTASPGPALSSSAAGSWGPVTGAEAVSLTTTYEYDDLNRVVSITDPTGLPVYVLRSMLDTDYLDFGVADDELGDLSEFAWWVGLAERYVELRSGRVSTSGIGVQSYDKPLEMTWRDAAGRTLRRSTVDITEVDFVAPDQPAVSARPEPETSPPAGSVAMGAYYELSRTVWRRDSSGTVVARSDWPLLQHQERYGTTEYRYDGLGRQTRMISPEGSVTETDFDFLDRPTATYIRTTDGMGGLTAAVKTSDMQYDGGGQGDGVVTRMRYFGTDAGTLPRVTTNYYDWRNRLIFVVSPFDPSDTTKLDTPDTAFAYDNLDRTVETALFEDDAARDSSFTPFGPDTTTKRIRYATNAYSQRGLRYRSRTAIDPSLSSPAFLSSNSWFDAKGRTIASSAPAQPMQKMTYDSLSRVVSVFVTDGSDGSGGVDDTFEEVDDVSSDRVIQQEDNFYTDGLLAVTASRQRLPGSTATGPLTVANSASTYMGFGYSDFDRRVAVVDFGASNSTAAAGTGSADVFATGGTDVAWTDVNTVLSSLSSYVPATSPTAPRVVQTKYNVRGLVGRTTDHMGVVTNTYYDDMDRPISTVVNATNWTTGTQLFWDTTALTLTWDSSAVSMSTADQDLATSQVYDLDGRVVLQTAHLHDATIASTSRQDTKYVYGVTKTTGGSELNSNELLAEIHYPDDTSGSPGSTAEYKVIFDYNAFGEIIRMTDQSGVEHSYEYDGAGRQIRDEVDLTGVVSGVTVDSAVLAIEQTFDKFGRLQTVTSLDSAGGSPGTVNEVRYEYDSLWNVYLLYQNATGSVATTAGNCGGDEDTQIIGFWYDIEDDAAGNYVRLDRMIYPSDFASAGIIDEPADLDPSSPATKVQAFTLTYDYGTTGGLDDLISRRLAHEADLTTVGGETMVQYEYLGLGLPVTVDYDKVGVSLSRSIEHDGSSAAGVYANLDRFGRIRRDLWVDDSFTTGTGGLSNQPAVFDRAYRYDNRGNLASDVEERQDYDTYASGSYDGYAVDQLHTYDAIGRLTATEVGRVTDPTALSLSIGTHVNGSEEWSLGELANWRTYGRDADADGDVADPLEMDARSFNAANELGEILFGDQGNDLVYSPAGNQTRNATKEFDEKPDVPDNPITAPIVTEYIYDAWNRLRAVKYEGTFVARHWYNGLGWMVRKRVSTLEPSQGVGGPDEERRYYYAPEWRMLEEHVDTDLGDSTDIDYKAQQFWGDRYIDDAVARRIDRDADSDYTDETESLFFYVTDRMFSVRQLLRGEATSNPFIVEEIYYSPYGVPYRRMTIDYAAPFGEFDSSADMSAFSTGLGNGGTIGDGTYAAEYDINRSGGVTFGDFSAIGGEFPTASESLAPTDWMSQPQRSDGSDNAIGYAGYVERHVGYDWLARHRVYRPDGGRWLTRDPLGYRDGLNLYGYLSAAVTSGTDPFGLSRVSLQYGGFIPGRLGSWLRQPMTLVNDWEFKTDQRGFGGGTFRVYALIFFDSEYIGDLDSSSSSVSTGSNISKRRKALASGGYMYQAASAKPRELIRQSNSKCASQIYVTASGGYPFAFGSELLADVGIGLSVNVSVEGPGEVLVDIRGTHDSFPDYEAILRSDGASTHMYQFETSASGPGLLPDTLGIGGNRFFRRFETLRSMKTPCGCGE